MSKQTDKNTEKLSTEVAKQAIIQERQERSKACEQEIQDVLKKHRCGMVVGHFQNSVGENRFTVDFPAQD